MSVPVHDLSAKRIRRLFAACLLFALLPACGALAQGLVLTPSSVTVDEGSSATFTVSMDASPGGTVDVPVSISTAVDANLRVSPASLRFNSGNYLNGQTVTVYADSDSNAVDGSGSVFLDQDDGFYVSVYERDAQVHPGIGGETEEESKERQFERIRQSVNLSNTQRIAYQIANTSFLLPVVPRGSPRAPGSMNALPEAPPGEGGGGGEPVTPQLPPEAAAHTWSLSVNSALRYEHSTYYHHDHSDSHRAGLTFRSSHYWDRVTLDWSIPVDVVDFDHELSEFNYTRIGITGTPRYYALFEEEHGLDLSLGLTAYYLRTFLTTSDEYYNPDHLGLGVMVAAQKTLGPVVLSGGVLAQRAWNLDGEDEVTGRHHLDVITVGTNAGIPLGESWALNGSLLYSHTRHLPGRYDADVFRATVTAAYTVAEKWTVDLSVVSDLANEDEKTLGVHAGLSWVF
jgi:hypothetical protein